MSEWIRRLRGALGIGVTWGLGWAPIGALLGAWFAFSFGAPIAYVAWRYALLLGVMGVVGGGIFASVLRLAEGRRRFDELSLPRFAWLGGIGGLVLATLSIGLGILGPGFNFLDLIMLGVLPTLGASSAAGSLAIARKAEAGLLAAEVDEMGSAAG